MAKKIAHLATAAIEAGCSLRMVFHTGIPGRKEIIGIILMYIKSLLQMYGIQYRAVNFFYPAGFARKGK